MKISYSKELLEPIIKDSINYKEVTLKLGLSYCNGSLLRLKNEISKYKIDISHFIHTSRGKSLPNEKIFIENSKTERTIIKNRIKKQNLIPYICECCGQDENWQGKIMPLILDHKNGINNDNRLENLRFLCSNCDSIQDTYKSKNRSIDRIRKINRNVILKENNRIQKKKEKEFETNILKEQLINSGINFKTKTWGVEVSKLLNKSPQYCLKLVKKKFPELLK